MSPHINSWTTMTYFFHITPLLSPISFCICSSLPLVCRKVENWWHHTIYTRTNVTYAYGCRGCVRGSPHIHSKHEYVQQKQWLKSRTAECILAIWDKEILLDVSETTRFFTVISRARLCTQYPQLLTFIKTLWINLPSTTNSTIVYSRVVFLNASPEAVTAVKEEIFKSETENTHVYV